MRKVVHVKLYSYEGDTRTLARGYTFTLEAPLNKGKWDTFMTKVCVRFNVEDGVLVRELDDGIVGFDSVLGPKEELELVILDEGVESGNNEEEVEEGVVEREWFDIGIFDNSRIQKDVPFDSITQRNILLSNVKGPWTVSYGNRWVSLCKEGAVVQLRKELVLHTENTVSKDFFMKMSVSTWIILLCHGGRFAFALYKAGVMQESKSIRRYVQRKKQGKRQVNQDRKGNTASSAGSYIRRFHERRLEEDIQEYLLSVSNLVQSADIILVHAPGVNRNHVFFSSSPLQLSDSRIRSIPITTRSATYTELEHIFFKLSTAKFGSIAM